MSHGPDPRLANAEALARQGQVTAAFSMIEEIAGGGDPLAVYALGNAYWQGLGAAQDHGKARELYARAAESGNRPAARILTNLLGSGIAGPRNWAEALGRLEQEGEADPKRAQLLTLIRAMMLDEHGDPQHLPAREPLSDAPNVAMFRAAFTPAECRHLIDAAEPRYMRSVVNVEGANYTSQVRTSEGSTFQWSGEDPFVHAINRRLAALSGTSVDRGEPLQILRYRPGQEYRPHFDWLEEPNPRMMTALIYLNEEYEGGETLFVETGLRVRGSAGDALVFLSQRPDGSPDPLSKHAGTPVVSGTKYIASRWIRAERYVP